MVAKWTPFERATSFNREMSEEEMKNMARKTGKTLYDVRRLYEEVKKDRIYLNSRYQVNIRDIPGAPGWPDMVHLSIKRLDKDRIGRERYRDFLRIKNELVGPEHEGVELYPAVSRNVDTSNQYHIWVIAEPGVTWPFGFAEGLTLGDTTGTGARQHPFDDD